MGEVDSVQPAPQGEPARSPAMELARAAAAGDVAATRLLLDSLAPRIERIVHMVMGGAHADADDVAQQALIAIVQALPSFRGECEPKSYASRIAVRVAVAARKRARARMARVQDAVEADAIASDQELPAEAVRASRRKAVIRELLTELPDEQAETLALRIMLGWSLEEVADATGAPVNTVRSRLRLGKQALRRRIEADPSLAEELEVAP